MNVLEARHPSSVSARAPAAIEGYAVARIAAALTVALADLFAIYVKTKNFHWHVSGPHLRDYHLLLDEQSEQILATTDKMADRVRKIGGTTLHSIGHIARFQRMPDNDLESVAAVNMLGELREDNSQLAANLRRAHALCGEYGDVASASLVENWIDEVEHRIWVLYEATH